MHESPKLCFAAENPERHDRTVIRAIEAKLRGQLRS
jgi:hypothetical protein